MKDRQEEIARWARQMGVPESALEQFLSERSSMPKGAPIDTLETGFFFIDNEDEDEDEDEQSELVNAGITPTLDNDEPVEKSASDELTSQSPAALHPTATFHPDDRSGTPQTDTALADRFDQEAIEPPPGKAEKLGRYQDLGVLGIGGMGEVRQVRDGNLRRTMAMRSSTDGC